MRVDSPYRRRRRAWVSLALLTIAVGLFGLAPLGSTASGASWTPFSFLTDETTFGWVEKLGLFASLAVAIAALVYAWVLARKVYSADQGTSRMREIAQAVREGSNAYLRRQF